MEELKNNNQDSEKKIQALRDMISNAEKTLQGAKAMLLQLEGKKKVGRKRKTEDDEDGKVVEGTFDGQIMLGTDGKQYPVPANYASKSKLVEGDMLKLTITQDGSFIYKQISPAARRILIGTVNQDPTGNYFIAAEGKAYKILLASVTYFKIEPGDEVTLIIPRDIESDWGAIENVLQRGRNDATNASPITPTQPKNIDDVLSDNGYSTKPEHKESSMPINFQVNPGEPKKHDIIDEWAPDLEELRKELEEGNKNNYEE